MKRLFFAAVVSAGISAFAAMPQRTLVAGSGRAAIIGPDANVTWQKKGCGNITRIWPKDGWVYYSNGDLWRTEIATGKRELVYKPCAKDGLYGFEILNNGNIVVAENGTGYITELAAGTTNAIVRFKGDPRDVNGKTPGLHVRYRMISKTAAGTYLVCCAKAGIVREYDAKGKLVWELVAPNFTFDVLRRENGNTLVSHLDGVTEFTPDKKAVWSIKCSDFPELKLSNLCGLQEFPNGNLVIGTYANGRPDRSRTTAFEITRDKKIVWSYAAPDRSMMTVYVLP